MYMSVLSNFDIVAISEWLGIPLVTVCFKDQLPTQKKEGYYVVNLESEIVPNSNGSHWVCLYVGKQKGRSFYYDSMGVPYMPKEIEQFTKEFHPYCNNRQVQSIDSTYCGWWTIAFMYSHYTNPHTSAKTLTNNFDSCYCDPKNNYNKLVSFFEKIIKQ
jgi:hypothetical protein